MRTRNRTPISSNNDMILAFVIDHFQGVSLMFLICKIMPNVRNIFKPHTQITHPHISSIKGAVFQVAQKIGEGLMFFPFPFPSSFNWIQLFCSRKDTAFSLLIKSAFCSGFPYTHSSGSILCRILLPC
jgi:hypothetical protein